MTEELIQLNEDEFNEQFPLVHNHLNPSAGWVYISENDADQRGCLFETYGAEYEFVVRQDPRCIWTLMDNNDGEPPFLASGCRWVNRLGYLISKVPVQEGKTIEVSLPDWK